MIVDNSKFIIGGLTSMSALFFFEHEFHELNELKEL